MRRSLASLYRNTGQVLLLGWYMLVKTGMHFQPWEWHGLKSILLSISWPWIAPGYLQGKEGAIGGGLGKS